jgi:long-chain acyl-CoA synthetase
MAAQSLLTLIEDAIRRFGVRPAYSSFGKNLSFHDLGVQSAALANWLVSLNLPKESRVAVMLPNIFQNPIAIAGVLRAGMVVVNVNPLYTARELAAQLNDSGASVLIVLENFAHTVEKARTQFGLPQLSTVVVTEIGDCLGVKGAIMSLVVRHVKKMVPKWQLPKSLHITRWPQVFSARATRAVKNPDHPILGSDRAPIVRGAEDLAFLQYTGGTTGDAKGAMLSHGNVLANLAQCADWLEPEALEQTLGKQATMVCALPLYHIFSLTACMMLGFRAGFKNLLLANPKDLGSVIRALSKEPVHLFPGVNTLFNALLNHPDFSKMDFSQLKVTVGGGMSVTAPVANRWRERTGCVMLEGYGLSETSPVVSATPRSQSAFNGSVGLPMPGTEVRIQRDDGTLVDSTQPDQLGEIVVRGPQVMRGYWKRDAHDGQTFTQNGFFKTGDIGRFDTQGFLHIVDRKKDMILVSGFNVYPNEIEQVVSEHPAVLECAAVGVPDESMGERVKLFVVTKKPQTQTPAALESVLAKFCAEHLTNYKRPKEIVFVDSLPKTAVGKVLKRALC